MQLLGDRKIPPGQDLQHIPRDHLMVTAGIFTKAVEKFPRDLQHLSRLYHHRIVPVMRLIGKQKRFPEYIVRFDGIQKIALAGSKIFHQRRLTGL